MLDWLLHSDLGGVLGFLLLLVAGFGATFGRAWWRAWKLTKEDPPTAEELEEIEAIGRSGTFRLSGNSSATARHDARPSKHEAGRQGGAKGHHDSRVVNSWRD